MERRLFGRTGLTVPVIGLGTWQTFDVKGSPPMPVATWLTPRSKTAPLYSDSSVMYGEAERVLGLALDGRRQEAIVATKVWTADDAEANRQIEAALGFVGGRVAAVQVPYNPHERDVEEVILPCAADLGMGVIIMRPFGQSLLRRHVPPDALAPLRPFGVTSGGRRGGPSGQRWLVGSRATRQQALLKWILSDQRCHVAIPATSNALHMRENAACGRPPWFGPQERAYVEKLAG